MVLLAIDVAILDKFTRLACLETSTLSCHAAAIGTADDVDLIHFSSSGPGSV
jgi:hypothetical protein